MNNSPGDLQMLHSLIDEISKQIVILRIIYNKRQQDVFFKEL